MTRYLRLLVVGVALGAQLLIALPPAHADCVSAEFRVWTAGSDDPSYPTDVDPVYIGPKECIVPTDWDEGGNFGANPKWGLVPDGYPEGIGVTVWYVWPPV